MYIMKVQRSIWFPMFIEPKRVQCFLAPVKCGNNEEALNDNSFVQTHVSLIVSIIFQELFLKWRIYLKPKESASCWKNMLEYEWQISIQIFL